MELGDWSDDDGSTPPASVSPAEAETVTADESREVTRAAAVADEVLARILRVYLTEVKCEVLALNGEPLRIPARGLIRNVDVMPLGIDKFDLLDCFRPGDVVRAQLVSYRRLLYMEGLSRWQPV